MIGYTRGGKLRLDVRTLTDEEATEAAVSLGRALLRQPGEAAEPHDASG